MPKALKFYDLERKKSFNTTKYTVKTIRTPSGMRKQAMTTAPSGIKSVRFVAK